jgi:hypothetical protein
VTSEQVDLFFRGLIACLLAMHVLLHVLPQLKLMPALHWSICPGGFHRIQYVAGIAQEKGTLF